MKQKIQFIYFSIQSNFPKTNRQPWPHFKHCKHGKNGRTNSEIVFALFHVGKIFSEFSELIPKKWDTFTSMIIYTYKQFFFLFYFDLHTKTIKTDPHTQQLFGICWREEKFHYEPFNGIKLNFFFFSMHSLCLAYVFFFCSRIHCEC